ncbi:MAG: hypothetical protein JXR37_34960 [Kiritimatiellae bacterium]|nr:hypothetical protein [Kiritimatiellia bacterium]
MIAAVDGFLSAGAAYILVNDRHGPGGIDVTKLDPRVDMSRGGAGGCLARWTRASTPSR